MDLSAYFASLNLLNLLSRMPAAVAQGLIWGLMALGVFVTFRLLDIADLTVDGSFATGGAVTVMLLLAGWPAWAALLAAILDMEESPVLKESCILKSRQYDKEERFREYIKLYEDIMRHGDIATGFDYPVKVNGRYIMSPSPIPRFDNPKMHQCPALQLFGAGREKRIYAIPPYTDVVSLDFEDYPFTPQSWDQCCAICGATDTYLDEIVMDDAGTRMFVCSDTDNCARRVAGQGGTAAPREEK